MPRYMAFNVRHARGRYAYGVRTVLGAPGVSCPVPLARSARRRLVRVARTCSTAAPSWAHVCAQHSTEAESACSMIILRCAPSTP
eukprot:scaffold27520_cov52-Phaeocystis_antarctica.AAC.4